MGLKRDIINPTAGSPTITLFQLHSNYHTRRDPRKRQIFIFTNKTLRTVLPWTHSCVNAFQYELVDLGQISKKYNSSSVMGGVCKV